MLSIVNLMLNHICVPDIPNINKILTNLGHRFVHQSGQDESSGRNSTFFGNRIAFRVYVVYSQIGTNTDYY